MEEDRRKMISMNRFAIMNKLDWIQTMAFKVACSTFILDCIKKDVHNYLRSDSRSSCTRDILSNILNDDRKKTLNSLVKDLMKMGGKKHLLMFLSGKGGSGKSYTIFTIERYCHHFCQYVSLPFEKNTIYITAITGSAAALIKDVTLLSATGIKNKK